MYMLLLLIHSFINRHVGCSYLMAIVNNAVLNMGHKYIFETLVLIVLDIYIAVNLLGHMVTHFVSF